MIGSPTLRTISAGLGFAVIVTTLGCTPTAERRAEDLPAQKWVFVDLVGRSGGMSAWSCPWFPDSAEFSNWSSRPIRVQAIEISLRQVGKPPKDALAAKEPEPGVPQTIPVDVRVPGYARARIEFREPTPDGRGQQTSVRLQGCHVTSPARITQAEYAD